MKDEFKTIWTTQKDLVSKDKQKKNYPREDGSDNKNLVPMLCEECLGEFWVFDLDLRTLKEKVKMQTNIWSVYHKEPGWDV